MTMEFTDKFVYMAHHFMLLPLYPFQLRFDGEGWWFKYFLSYLWVWLSVEGDKNVA